MTIQNVLDNGVWCSWFNGSKIELHCFQPESLTSNNPVKNPASLLYEPTAPPGPTAFERLGKDN
jgi:hypothetical protein